VPLEVTFGVVVVGGGGGVRGRPLKEQTVDWCDKRTSTSSKFDKDQEPAP